MSFVENVGRRDIEFGGMVGAWIDVGNKSLNGYERNRLYRNLGTGEDGVPVFADWAHIAGANLIEDGRAAVPFDIEGDGDLDILVQSFERPVALLVSSGRGTGNWLRIALRGTKSNRDAIGARVVVEAGGSRQLREVASSAGYLAGQSLTLHFGLGTAERVERLEVFWPSGERTVLRDLAANRLLVITEGDGESAAFAR